MFLITILGIIIIFSVYGFHMIKNKLWSELAVFTSILAISLLFAVGNLFNISGPLELMRRFLSPLGNAILR